MQLGIKYKFFLTLFLTSSIVVACMFFFMQWSFNRGFLYYINSQDLKRLDSLADHLLAHYAREKSWEFLRKENWRWREIQLQSKPEQELDDGIPLAGTAPPPSPPPPELLDPLRIGPRTMLLDADKKWVAGGDNTKINATNLRPLEYRGETVGYLTIVAPAELTQIGDRLYVEKQTHIFGAIALTMIMVSMALGMPLINHLLGPVKAMIRGAADLTSGKFHTRIPVTTADELGRLSRDFNLLATTLEKNEQSRRQYLADLSHELRTPLAVMLGEIEAVQDGIRAVEPTLAVLHGEVLRLNRLVGDLYELSLSDKGDLQCRKQRIDPVIVLEQAIELYQQRMATRGITLAADLPEDGTLTLHADAHRLQQLFTNLLENSLRYTDPGGRVEVELRQDATELKIAIRDSAPGVTEEELAKLFERFYRVESSRNRAKGGSGLGLAICRNIVNAHDGRIEAHPSTLGGVLIEITFPVSRQECLS